MPIINILASDFIDRNLVLYPEKDDSEGLLFYCVESGLAYYRINGYEELRLGIIPSSGTVSDSSMSGILADKNLMVNDSTSGLYFANFTNPISTTQIIKPKVHIPDKELWENTQFNLHWLHYRSQDNITIYDNNKEGIYSYPSKVTQDELKLIFTVSDILNSDATITISGYMREIKNSYDSVYNVLPPSGGPYWVSVAYDQNSQTNPSGWENNNKYFFSAGSAGNGIVNLSLPYYDPRQDPSKFPAKYYVTFGNYWAGAYSGQYGYTGYDSVGCSHRIYVDCQSIDNGLRTLDETMTNFDVHNLQKVGEIEIPAGLIDRRRLVVGVKDIQINSNIYYKSGTFISNPYSVDFDIYTFSLDVDEYIPDYPNLNKYDLVKYYIEFNSQEWVRISPTKRDDEFDGEKIIPKMIIFDKLFDETNFQNVTFIVPETSIRTFRLKIDIDLSSVPDKDIISPEIRNYKCIVFDKNQLIE